MALDFVDVFKHEVFCDMVPWVVIRVGRTKSLVMAELEIVIAPTGTHRQADVFTAHWGDILLVTSRTPFFDSARKLLEVGADPNDLLVMCHHGSATTSLRARVAVAAKLAVTETNAGPRYVGEIWGNHSASEADGNALGANSGGGDGSARADVQHYPEAARRPSGSAALFEAIMCRSAAVAAGQAVPGVDDRRGGPGRDARAIAFALHAGEFAQKAARRLSGGGVVSFWCVRAVLTLHLPDLTMARSNAMTEPKNPPALSRPRQLAKALKGPAHRDRRRAKLTKLYDLDVEAARETRPQPSLPLVRWLSRKDVD
jgi:hypothetical protein